MDRRLRRELMQRVLSDARVIAGQFGLEYRAIEAERSDIRSRYGICYDDGTIKIRLAHAVNGRPLKYSSIVDTLCHELAHLRHFDHGPQFRSFYTEILAWARQRGIYRPGKRARPDTRSSPRSAQMDMDLGTAIRTGRLPSLRESLAGILGPRPEETPRGTAAEDARAPRVRPSQLELFG